MLPKTPPLPAFDPLPDPGDPVESSHLGERFKAYADAPDGMTRNKLLVYRTHDLDHSVNLLARLRVAGWSVRAAWHEFDHPGQQGHKRALRIDKY